MSNGNNNYNFEDNSNSKSFDLKNMNSRQMSNYSSKFNTEQFNNDHITEPRSSYNSNMDSLAHKPIEGHLNAYDLQKF
jgi:hypothetical protein